MYTAVFYIVPIIALELHLLHVVYTCEVLFVLL